MLNDSEVFKKGKYLNKLGIVFKDRNFYEKSFDFDAESDSLEILRFFLFSIPISINRLITICNISALRAALLSSISKATTLFRCFLGNFSVF